MPTHNPNNVRIKRRYFFYLKEAKRQSEPSVDAVAKALARFEEYTKYRDFGTFHFEQAIAFKRYLTEQQSRATGLKLSKATMHATLAQLRRFFLWLADQPGYRSKLKYDHADYFNLSEKETRIATAKREKPYPTVEQVKHVLQLMPSSSDVERRNRALLAFTLLTGARDSAIASMKLKHIDLAAGTVMQDAREVKTKFSKTFTTAFFPVGGEVRRIVEEWVRHLRAERFWGNDDPLFPATQVVVGPTQHFETAGLKREHWRSAGPIRAIFKESFKAAGLTYFNPHSLRNTLVQLGERLCGTPEEFKAWSQNLGHEKVLTTFNSYGYVALQRQAEILRALGEHRPSERASAEAIAEAVARHLRSSGGLA